MSPQSSQLAYCPCGEDLIERSRAFYTERAGDRIYPSMRDAARVELRQSVQRVTIWAAGTQLARHCQISPVLL